MLADFTLTRRSFAVHAAGLAAWSTNTVAQATGSDPKVYRSDAVLLAQAYGCLHPGLYRYNTPEAMSSHFEWLATYLSEPRTSAQAYVAFARLTAAVRCGHSYPNFYNQSKALQSTLFGGKDRLPFHFRWIGQRMIVTRDLSAGAGLRPGTEILRIGGVSAAQVLATLMPLARADGSNDGKRRRILGVTGVDTYEAFDLYLPMLLPSLVQRGEVDLEVSSRLGERRRLTVELLTAARRSALPPSPIDQPAGSPLWTLTAGDDGTARLTMPTWGVYNSTWDWRTWLNQALDDLASNGSRSLLIDLRGNEGGLDCGDLIVSRLIDRDLVVTANARRVRYRKVPADLDSHLDTWDQSFRDWGEQAIGPDGAGFYALSRSGDGANGNSVIRAAGRRFKGKVAVLVDAVNSSATFQFAQTVKDRGLATLVGETTGGNRRGINGGAFFFLRLPASGIEVDIPLVGYFPATPEPDAGIEPDIAVTDTADDIAMGADPCLTTATQVIR